MSFVQEVLEQGIQKVFQLSIKNKECMYLQLLYSWMGSHGSFNEQTHSMFHLPDLSNLKKNLTSENPWRLSWKACNFHMLISSTAPNECYIINSQNHRIIEYPELDGTLKDHWIQLLALHTTTQKSDHISSSFVQTLLELWQAQCHDRFPGDPVPVPDHPLSEVPFPDIQPEPSL